MSSSEECSEYDDCSSSEDEAFPGFAGEKGQGYLFEPLAKDHPERTEQRKSVPVSGRSDDPLEWPCSCGCCQKGNKKEENRFCCQEGEAFKNRINIGCEETGQGFVCLTQHPSFEPAILNVDTLRIAYMTMRQHDENDPQKSVAKSMRYTAYRQTIRWCFGYLGKYNRRPLPSCVMHKIRNKFPEPDGQYVEFQFVDL